MKSRILSAVFVRNILVMEVTSTGTKVFIQEVNNLLNVMVCKKRFLQKEILNKHFCINLGQKPFICPICKTSFAQKSDLKEHLKTHCNEIILKSELSEIQHVDR